MSNLTEHKCAGKCPEFKGDQCHHCLIQQIEKREFELGVAPEDAYVKCGTSQVIDCTGISSKKVELRFKAGEVVVTASPEFKVGDWVVLANTISTEPSLAQILKTDGRWSIVKWLEDDTESNIRLDFLRHATPEEINAGHRLDHFVAVNDMGDDAHIENHISPNCRINCFQDDTSMGTRTVDIEAENERLKTENLAMQAEIDELQQELEAQREETINGYSKISDLRLERDDLQNRVYLLEGKIKEALNTVYAMKGKADCDHLTDKEQSFVYGFGYELHEILKEEQALKAGDV